MSEKTKLQKMLPWLGAFVIAIVVVFPLNFIWKNWVISTPIIPAVGMSTVQAINEFGGNPSEAFITQRIAMVASLIILFVMGPVLWVNNSHDDESIWRRVGWYGGVSIVMMGFLITLAGLGHYLLKGNSQWEMAERSRNVDKVRTELMALGNEVMELYWLPREQGGAGQDLSTITLEDLKQRHAVENTYVLNVTTDSSVTLYGISNRQGEDSQFENVNKAQGKIQLAMKVYPIKLEIKMLQADSLKN